MEFQHAVWTKPTGATRLILIRHGETDWNREKRFQGHIDIPLNAHGVAQARRVAQFMAGLKAALKNPGQNNLFDLAISSDLGRARATAQTLLEAHPSPIEFNSALRERDYGHLSGKTADEMQQFSPTEFAGLQARDPHSPVHLGESLHAFYQRVIDQFEAIRQANLTKSILIVAHGGVLDCIYRHCTQFPLHLPRQWLLPNCALNIVDHHPDTGYNVTLWGYSLPDPEQASQGLDEVDGRVA